jgi:hypothetical protein
MGVEAQIDGNIYTGVVYVIFLKIYYFYGSR